MRHIVCATAGDGGLSQERDVLFGVGIVIGTQFPGDIPETMAGNLAAQLIPNEQSGAASPICREAGLRTTSGRAEEAPRHSQEIKAIRGLLWQRTPIGTC